MAAGTADIAFAGGRLVLPAQTLYDRQLLVDHVISYARRQPPLRVKVDSTTWIVELPDPQHPISCRACSRRLDRVRCQRMRNPGAVYCVACAVARPRLSMALLEQLPGNAILCDVKAHSAYGGEWIAWTRWPQATPPEIVEDMRLQRRFAPVLTWTCTEIRMAPAAPRRTRRSSPPRNREQSALPSAPVRLAL